MSTAFVTFVDASRAVNDPLAWPGNEIEAARGLPRWGSDASSASVTGGGQLRDLAFASVWDEPRPITGLLTVVPTPRRETEAQADRRERATRIIRLLDEWMADESGYDERTWPALKAALERDRLSIGSASDE